MATPTFDFGMIGLGVMGRNLLLNMADHGFKVIGYDKDNQKTLALESSATANTVVKGVNSLQEMLNQLNSPRRIMMLVPAGQPVDDVLQGLQPLLAPDDIVIDGGNSHYTDTLRRLAWMKEKGLHFVGIGISGGEHGARTGPSIMPGGDPQAYKHLQPILESIAAKVNGDPCVAYLGKGAAGHYVKMVHNGIEYAIMQLISEIYDLLHRGAGKSNDQLHEIFNKWNEGDLQSYLVEITSEIFLKSDDKTGKKIIDLILDKAGSKGTGKWTSQDAMDLGVAIPTIDIAVAMRALSSLKDERIKASKIYHNGSPALIKNQNIVEEAGSALLFGMLICYAQGLALLKVASSELQMEIPLEDAVKVWRGGCIIRSSLLEIFYKSFQQNPGLSNILLNPEISKIVNKTIGHTRNLLVQFIQSGIPAAGLSSALGYFDAYASEQMPTNLVQAQRDFFGAHTYQRVDMAGTFHTEWQ
ncbi:MAG: phosphogluconate dehydrogenase (NADP(+)-dependent, decarboxylating) [Bacteroidetes bacterium]|nr:MAG: phosphogluconate dehydrogenase (NADP(+)-dependent, decarboxylating) [Bacteroidota bacterium]